MGLLAVLAVLALLGGAMVALAAQSSTITYQTQRMQQRACVENLQASGAAWARMNRSSGAMPAPGRPGAKTLDVSALDVPGGLLTVEALPADANGTPVRIACQCGSGNRAMQAAMGFVIPGN
jgi:hypothetical protein